MRGFERSAHQAARMTLLVTASDPQLPAMLRVGGSFPSPTFTTAEQLRAVLEYKPGALVLLLDETQVELVTSSQRKDIRAVVIVTPKRVPAVFPRPVVAVIERPLLESRVVNAVRAAAGSLQPDPAAR